MLRQLLVFFTFLSVAVLPQFWFLSNDVCYKIHPEQPGKAHVKYGLYIYGVSAIFLIGLTSISSTVPLFTKPTAIHAVSPHRVTRPAVLWSVREMFVLSRLYRQQMPCHSERALIWRFNVAGNNETYLGLFIKFRGPCVVSIFLLIYFQQDATLHSSFISGKLLYMFRVVSPPTIRSTHN